MAINPMQSIQAAGRKLANMLARGVVKRTTDTTGTQSMQLALMEGEIRDNLEHPQEFGFTSQAPTGSEAIAAFFGGNRDHGSVLLVFDKATRPKDLSAGETCVFNAHGCKIYLRAGGNIEIIAPGQVTITSPTVTMSGNLEVTGDISSAGQISDGTRSMSADRAIYNSHTHTETGSTTQTPNQGM